jgi:ferredoxin-NADP reductase
MAMIRARAEAGDETPVRLLYSSRTIDDVVYRGELERLAGGALEVVHTLTRAQPEGWAGYGRRVDAAMLAEVAWPADAGAATFVCGSTPFVERVARTLVELGHPPESIRTERYGGVAR